MQPQQERLSEDLPGEFLNYNRHEPRASSCSLSIKDLGRAQMPKESYLKMSQGPFSAALVSTFTEDLRQSSLEMDMSQRPFFSYPT